MDYNSIIILIGSIIIIVALYFLLRNKKEDFYGEYITTSPLNENHIKDFERLIREGNQKTIDEINRLKLEIRELKKHVKTMENLIEEHKKDDSLQNENFNNMEEENFNYLLNYNKFIHKNKDVIELFKNNKTPEEIARILNKSIREVEMVTKLVK
ncbi:hypothetical protein [Natronincola ferrireducens]|uniref:Uncharacterized protein n=1 Tax=Natronincola ferrireducens TaxID=393762 RepID=A0A1G9C4V8_9FIRM|nr:hypothetical protein [Natronincola ferrireducens]SDK46385.1 hypothetical protein SAMN05660472_01356 [Natronincola ferrireducens]